MPTQPKKKRAPTTWIRALKEWNRSRHPTVYCVPKHKFNGKVTGNWKKVKEIQKEIEKKDAARKKVDYILKHGERKTGKFQKRKSSKKSK